MGEAGIKDNTGSAITEWGVLVDFCLQEKF